MRLGPLATILAALAGLPATRPAAAAEPYPPAIARMVEADVKGCPEGRKAGRIQDGYLTPADFNGDGIADYVVDQAKSNCFDSLIECGSAGCPASVMMSSGATFREVRIGYVQGFGIVQTNGRAALRLDLHGSSCGGSGAAACWSVLAWNGSGFIRGKGRKWRVTRLAPDRILFEGPHNRQVSDRSEAQRDRSIPNCSMVHVVR